MGLVHYLGENETFWEHLLAYALQFCPPNQLFRALGFERELRRLLFTSEDAKEGLTPYVEKRAANFKAK